VDKLPLEPTALGAIRQKWKGLGANRLEKMHPVLARRQIQVTSPFGQARQCRKLELSLGYTEYEAFCAEAEIPNDYDHSPIIAMDATKRTTATAKTTRGNHLCMRGKIKFDESKRALTNRNRKILTMHLRKTNNT
jgi:hypothetical protein